MEIRQVFFTDVGERDRGGPIDNINDGCSYDMT